MSSSGSKPSKWWFWGVVVAANVLYPVLLLVLFVVARVTVFWAADLLFFVVSFPAVLLVEWVAKRSIEDSWPSPLVVWLPVLLWELGAVLLGLACYGVAALICAVRRGRRKEGNESQE